MYVFLIKKSFRFHLQSYSILKLKIYLVLKLIWAWYNEFDLFTYAPHVIQNHPPNYNLYAFVIFFPLGWRISPIAKAKKPISSLQMTYCCWQRIYLWCYASYQNVIKIFLTIVKPPKLPIIVQRPSLNRVWSGNYGN